MKLFKTDEERFTSDFNDMLKIVLLNSLGFFFIGFWTPIIANINMGATGLQLSLIVSVQVLGRMNSGFIVGFITDRIKSRTFLVLIGSFGRALAYFIIYTAIITNSIYMLGIGTFILGFMAGVFWVPFNTFIAEKSLTTFGTDLEFFAAIGAVRLHIKFVVQGIAFTVLAEKLGSFRGKFLYHFRTAFAAYSSYHSNLPCK